MNPPWENLPKTVREYHQILEDTLLVFFISPFTERRVRQLITKASKFYLFDVGVAGILSKRVIEEEKGILFGKAFEHFILMELVAYRSYLDLDYEIEFWRTKNGLEVDFILGKGKISIEIKGSGNVRKTDLKSLLIFNNEYNPQKSILVCNEKFPRKSRRY